MSSSLHEINIQVRAENRASYAFRTLLGDVVSLGIAFGALDSQTGRTVMQVFTVIRVMTTLKVLIGSETVVTIANTAAKWLNTAAQWALNAAYAMEISLLTMGIGLIAATAGYMLWLAQNTQAAASAQASYNEELERQPTGRGITREGEAAFLRRGVE